MQRDANGPTRLEVNSLYRLVALHPTVMLRFRPRALFFSLSVTSTETHFSIWQCGSRLNCLGRRLTFKTSISISVAKYERRYGIARSCFSSMNHAACFLIVFTDCIRAMNHNAIDVVLHLQLRCLKPVQLSTAAWNWNYFSNS